MPATACSAPSKGRVRQVNEARILRAAERVFADSGFAGARMAEIAAAAGVPKANLHYYFRSKRAIYRAVLDNILALWLAETASITETAEPGAALARYIRAKMRFSRRYPDASRVFANEIIHGAREIGPFLRGDMKALIDGKAAIIEGWIADGRMAAMDPRHLFVAIWALTQTFADFAAQVHAVMGVKSLSEAQFAAATEEVVALVLRGCAIDLATARMGDTR
jgi:TetR/AcrR family transcriptional regulator